jgi:hypothetical protein
LKLKSSIDYIETIQDKVKIDQIAPENSLHTNIITNSVNSIILDYRYGLELGLNYVAKQKK